MKTNQEYKNASLEALKGRWAPAVVCTIVYMLIAGGLATGSCMFDLAGMRPGVLLVFCGSSFLLSFLVNNPLAVGYYCTFNDLYKSGNDRLTGNMLKTAFGKVLRNGWGIMLMYIFIFLWSLLLVIPGLIKSFSYAMTPYILVDYPELSANQAINLSRKMMKGHKFDYFWLCLSFLGWILLGALTLGIGYLWLVPYITTASAAFYQDVKAEYESRTAINN